MIPSLKRARATSGGLHESFAFALAALVLLLVAGGASAQILSLYYKEVVKDGRVYVFNTPEGLAAWEKSGEMGKSITQVGHGPNGETVIAENEVAIDLYNLKHDRPPYVRATPKAPAPFIPTSLKIGDGELKFGLLLQGWYVSDDSPVSSGTSWLGNTTGQNSFRLRRAEVKLYGKITPSWGFEVMFDPAKPQSAVAGQDGKILQDFAVTFLGLKGHEISLGQKKIALTEESGRGSSDLDFPERAQIVRTFSDRRETGLFYKGELGKVVTAYASFSNGTPSNTNDDSNDTLFAAARLDIKPVAGLVVGGSAGTSGGETTAHLSRERYGAHIRYDGPDSFPLGFRFEYMAGKDGAANGTELERSGYYGTLLYTFAKQYQLAVRYDVLDNNENVAGNETKMFTAGFHYMIKGKNINLKLDYFAIEQEGRRINNVLEEEYHQMILAAQIAF